MPGEILTYDVAVVGGGNAGLCAALTASEAGARVLVLESAPRVFRGGNSRHTRNMRCMHDSPTDVLTGAYTKEEYYADLWGVTGGQTDEALARLAGKTGGLVAQDALAELPDRLRASSADPALSVRHDLWHNVWMFALLVLLPSTEWVLRRQWGMR